MYMTHISHIVLHVHVHVHVVPPMDYSPWSSKILINRNRLKKFMHVGIDVKCMHTNFGGRHFSGFGDIATFKNGQISLSIHGL